jgi:hypothetical protein
MIFSEAQIIRATQLRRAQSCTSPAAAAKSCNKEVIASGNQSGGASGGEGDIDAKGLH